MRQQIRKVIYKSETAVSIDLCYCMGKQGNNAYADTIVPVTGSLFSLSHALAAAE